MITLTSPHMGINDDRTPTFVRMDRELLVGQYDSPLSIVDRVAQQAEEQPNGRFADVVFSCHGRGGYLQMGTGFDTRHVGLFSRWVGKVEKIWFIGCRIARTEAGTQVSKPENGYNFCSGIARAARCYVVAPTETQADHIDRRLRLPLGQLDTFEGLVVQFNPEGVICRQTRYPSTYRQRDGHAFANS